MRKSTLFISVVLTTFMLAILYGVVSNHVYARHFVWGGIRLSEYCKFN